MDRRLPKLVGRQRRVAPVLMTCEKTRGRVRTELRQETTTDNDTFGISSIARRSVVAGCILAANSGVPGRELFVALALGQMVIGSIAGKRVE